MPSSVLVGRLEERELDLKKEYNSLHQRHTEVSGWGRKEGNVEIVENIYV